VVLLPSCCGLIWDTVQTLPCLYLLCWRTDAARERRAGQDVGLLWLRLLYARRIHSWAGYYRGVRFSMGYWRFI